MVGGSLYDSAYDFGWTVGKYEVGCASIWEVGWSGIKAAASVVSTALFLRGISAQVPVYRGVSAEHHEIANARQGIVNRRGGPNTAEEHAIGWTDSRWTSWSTSRRVAERFADEDGPGGVILQDRIPPSQLYRARNALPEEFEVLREGAIRVPNTRIEFR